MASARSFEPAHPMQKPKTGVIGLSNEASCCTCAMYSEARASLLASDANLKAWTISMNCFLEDVFMVALIQI
jgi:hypothetical protein